MPKPPAAKLRSRKSRSRPAPVRRRRLETGGQARSEQTRAALLTAALDVFGEMGYASASTRTIAGRAKLTLPVLAYHFGGKEGLYLACAEHIVARASARLSPTLRELRGRLAEPGLTHAELLGLLDTFLNTIIDLMVGNLEPRSLMGFVMREQADPTAAFDILYSGIISKVLNGCSQLVGRLLGLPANHEETRLYALTCLGQAFIFRAMRAAALRTLGWKSFKGEHLDAVRRVVLAQAGSSFAKRSRTGQPPAGKKRGAR